ncbi:hypothetical protein AAFN75_02700 [Algibacter sp. AS12]|uniref:hypothetical protein n=1 Tax=Algibacter sp. AS12 TaxID=3135773 RepID=UPI00398ABBEE
MKPLKDLRIAILLCLTLGLAPFYPEPHVWGKLKWVFGGAHGMEIKDWFDLLMHGFPFLFLLWIIALKLLKEAS